MLNDKVDQNNYLQEFLS